MINIMKMKNGNANFNFIAKHPASIFALGSVLCIFAKKNEWAIILMIVSVILHMVWLKK